MFEYIEKIMDKGIGLTLDEYNEIAVCVNSSGLEFERGGIRYNEGALKNAIFDMRDSNISWYKAKIEGDRDEVQKQLELYNQAKEKALILMNECGEKITDKEE